MIPSPALTSSAGIHFLEFFDYFITNIPLALGVIIELYVFVYLFPLDELEGAILRYVKIPTPAYIRWMLQSKLLVGVVGLIFVIGVLTQVHHM